MKTSVACIFILCIVPTHINCAEDEQKSTHGSHDYGEPDSYLPYYSSSSDDYYERARSQPIKAACRKAILKRKAVLKSGPGTPKYYGPPKPEKDPLKDKTYFYIESYKLQKKINTILHPVLHGCAEKKVGFFEEMKKSASEAGSALYNGDVAGAWEKAKSNSGFWNTLKTVAGGVIGNYAGKETERVLFHGGFYNDSGEGPSTSNGSLSLQVLHAAEEEIKEKFPDWNQKKQCPEGILNCLKLGHNSKNILASMYAFFSNIRTYEEKRKKPFFSQEESNRVFMFLSNLVNRICEENILFAVTNKSSSAPDDKTLKPYLKIVNYLVALPTEFHDITEHWKKNRNEIDELLSFLPLEQRRNLYDYMKKLAGRAKDPLYGHRSGDSSINLLFSGDSGTGKTFVGSKLPELLGFTRIVLTFDELRRGQETSFNELDDLVEGANISGMETKILRLIKGAHKGIGSLNTLTFVDEIDEDRNYSVSELKEQFDQFKKMHFPSLGLSVPGFMNCIFTTNNKKLLKNPALISRFIEIQFPRMTEEKKAQILFKFLQSKMENFPELQQHYDENYFKYIVDRIVNFDKRINIRILIDNIDSILYFLDAQEKVKAGETFFVPVEDRTEEPESLDEFLKRTLGNIRLEHFQDDESSDEESNKVSDIPEIDDKSDIESETILPYLIDDLQEKHNEYMQQLPQVIRVNMKKYASMKNNITVYLQKEDTTILVEGVPFVKKRLNCMLKSENERKAFAFCFVYLQKLQNLNHQQIF